MTTAQGAPGSAPVDELLMVANRLIERVANWTPARWSATRAESMHGLVQRLADLTADVEGQPRRDVPRLENDLALRDQLRVMVGDLVCASPPGPIVAEATDLVRQVNRSL